MSQNEGLVIQRDRLMETVPLSTQYIVLVQNLDIK